MPPDPGFSSLYGLHATDPGLPREREMSDYERALRALGTTGRSPEPHHIPDYASIERRLADLAAREASLRERMTDLERRHHDEHLDEAVDAARFTALRLMNRSRGTLGGTPLPGKSTRFTSSRTGPPRMASNLGTNS